MSDVIVQNNMDRVVVLSHRVFKDGKGANTSVRVVLGIGLNRVDAETWDLVKNIPIAKVSIEKRSLVVSDKVDDSAEKEQKALDAAVRESTVKANEAKQKVNEKQARVDTLKRRKQTLEDQDKATAQAEADAEELDAEEEALLAELDALEAGAADESTSTSPGGDGGSTDVV